MATVKLQSPRSISETELVINRLFQSGVISATFAKRILNKLMRLGTTLCEEYDKLIEELNQEVVGG